MHIMQGPSNSYSPQIQLNKIQDPNKMTITEPSRPQIEISKSATAPNVVSGPGHKGQNFVSWVQKNHPELIGNPNITSIKAEFKKNAAGGIQWESDPVVTTTDKEKNLQQNKRDPVKVEITWTIKYKDADGIEQTIEPSYKEYFKPDMPQNYKEDSKALVQQRLMQGFLQAKQYVKIMKAPLDPGTPHYEKVKTIINSIAKNEFNKSALPIPSKMGMVNATNMHVQLTDAVQFDVSLGKMTRDGNAELKMQAWQKKIESGQVQGKDAKGEEIKVFGKAPGEVKILNVEPDQIVDKAAERQIGLPSIVGYLQKQITVQEKEFKEFFHYFKRDEDVSKMRYLGKFINAAKDFYRKITKNTIPTFSALEKEIAELNQKAVLNKNLLVQRDALAVRDPKTLSDVEKLQLTLINSSLHEIERARETLTQFQLNSTSFETYFKDQKKSEGQLLAIQNYIALLLLGKLDATEKDPFLLEIETSLTAGTALTPAQEKSFYKVMSKKRKVFENKGNVDIGNPPMPLMHALSTFKTAYELRTFHWPYDIKSKQEILKKTQEKISKIAVQGFAPIPPPPAHTVVPTGKEEEETERVTIQEVLD